MSILYANPNLPFLINDVKNYTDNNGINISDEHIHNIFSGNYYNLYYKFNLYLDFKHQAISGINMFFQINSKNHILYLAVNPLHQLIIVKDNDILLTTDIIENELTEYKIHINTAKEEIQIYVNDNLIFNRKNKLVKLFNYETLLTCDVKNCYNAFSFSNIIIGDTDISDLKCQLLTSSSDIDDVDIHAVQFIAKHDVNNDKQYAQVLINNDVIYTDFVKNINKTDFLYLNPINHNIWTATDVNNRNFYLKNGDVT